MEGQLNLTQQNVTGRIIKSLGGFYYVAAEQEDRVIECRARGVFRQQNIKPCVGDWVEVELTDEGKGYVVKVQPRKNSLVRRRWPTSTSWCWWSRSPTRRPTPLRWTS